jgi:hypothetical protein
MTKRYKATRQLSLPVFPEGKAIYVIFSEGGNCLTVTDKKVQDAIEATYYFRKREIILLEQTNDGAQPEKQTASEFEEKEFPEVTGIQAAVEILKGEPYGVAAKLLKSPEDVKTQAESCNVRFPNLTL